MSKASGVFGKIVIWVLVVLLILGITAIALFFVMREKGADYYVEYNGERYLGGTDDKNIFLAAGERQEFFVKTLAGGDTEFSVKVVSNADNNLRFSVGTELYYLYNGNEELDDYSAVFDLQTSATGFSLSIPSDMTIETAIEAKYGGDAVLLDGLSDSLSYFELLVTVGKSEVVLRFAFEGQAEIPSSGIEIDPPSIIF